MYNVFKSPVQEAQAYYKEFQIVQKKKLETLNKKK